jgi:hypothetical protein
MPPMVGNLSIPSKLIALLAVPVAGTVLLGVAAVAGGLGERARAAEEARVAAVDRAGGGRGPPPVGGVSAVVRLPAAVLARFPAARHPRLSSPS